MLRLGFVFGLGIIIPYTCLWSFAEERSYACSTRDFQNKVAPPELRTAHLQRTQKLKTEMSKEVWMIHVFDQTGAPIWQQDWHVFGDLVSAHLAIIDQKLCVIVNLKGELVIEDGFVQTDQQAQTIVFIFQVENGNLIQWMRLSGTKAVSVPKIVFDETLWLNGHFGDHPFRLPLFMNHFRNNFHQLWSISMDSLEEQVLKVACHGVNEKASEQDPSLFLDPLLDYMPVVQVDAPTDDPGNTDTQTGN